MMSKKRTPQQIKTRKVIVMLSWSAVVAMMLLTREKDGVERIDDYVKNNLEMIVTFVWHGMVAAISCLLCLLLRITLKTITQDEAGSIVAMTFNTALAVTISLTLNDISLHAPNTLIEEMILCSTVGYCLYEMCFLRVVKTLQDKYKALGTVALTSFVANCLLQSRGASLLLMYIFILSSPMSILKMPALGSAKYVNSVAYKCSVWAAYVFTAHRRLFVGLGLSLTLSEASRFRFVDFESPFWCTVYCAGVGATMYMLEVVDNVQQERLTKAAEGRKDSPKHEDDLRKKDGIHNINLYKRKSVQAYAY